jgi:hypothetical protein
VPLLKVILILKVFFLSLLSELCCRRECTSIVLVCKVFLRLMRFLCLYVRVMCIACCFVKCCCNSKYFVSEKICPFDESRGCRYHVVVFFGSGVQRLRRLRVR